MPAHPPQILILNGPNLNRLGKREPHIYGATTLPELEQKCRDTAKSCGLEAICHQSNHEGQLIDWIHAAADTAQGTIQGIILNGGGLTHSSIALMDAIKSVALPTIEVHITNIHAREEFRAHSYPAKAATGVIAGLGVLGYELAIRALADIIAKRSPKP
ncbi:MAG: type II 3-dehydroquinate dehydratase [Alphaproteobacteria bacterium]|nr:type II 3-dehydroquinate dehydratase [Alphaproteobacteria bacterium]